MTHESATHPHRQRSSGSSPVRAQILATVERAIPKLDEEVLRVSLQLAATIELLAHDDFVGAAETLEQAAAEITEIRA